MNYEINVLRLEWILYDDHDGLDAAGDIITMVIIESLAGDVSKWSFF